MSIKEIIPYQILDSRGEPTLLVKMIGSSGVSAEFSVPSGSSKGANEAREKRDGEGPFGGNGVLGCIDVIKNVIAPKFIRYPLHQQADFDDLLVALDGSEHKENLGGNTLLGLSGAYLKLSAKTKKQPLWQYIAETNNTSPEFPRLFANIVGGGKHAPGLDIQEYMAVPINSTPSAATKLIYDIYHTIQTVMENLYGPSAKLVGDEGGLAPIGTSSEVVLEALSQLNSKLEEKFDIALDAAANTFYKDGIYTIEMQKLHASELERLYESWNSKFNLLSIEDPFAENDIEGIEILKTMPKQDKPFMVIADDYTVTNKNKIEQMQTDAIFDGIIIKPNQVGTITEAFEAVGAARASKAKVIVSHRSGETNDDFIVDFAYGIGAMGLKLGAPIRGERVAKYNRLLEIEADLEIKQTQTAMSAPGNARGPQATQKEAFNSAGANTTKPAPTIPSTPTTPPATTRPPSSTGSPGLAVPPAPNSTKPLTPTPVVAPNTPNPPTPPVTPVAPVSPLQTQGNTGQLPAQPQPNTPTPPPSLIT